VRDSPALLILPALREKGAIVQVHDSKAMIEAQKMFPEFPYAVLHMKLVKMLMPLYF